MFGDLAQRWFESEKVESQTKDESYPVLQDLHSQKRYETKAAKKESTMKTQKILVALVESSHKSQAESTTTVWFKAISNSFSHPQSIRRIQQVFSNHQQSIWLTRLAFLLSRSQPLLSTTVPAPPKQIMDAIYQNRILQRGKF